MHTRVIETRLPKAPSPSETVVEIDLQTDQVTIPVKLCNLPPLNAIAAQILVLTADPDIDMGQLSRVIGGDPALAADVLFLANSSLFGFASRMHSLRHAMALLGLDRIKALAMTVAMRGFLGKPNPLIHQCWQHSVACALVCDELSAIFDISSDRAYTAGIMHDIGRLGLLVAYPQEYEQVVRNAAARCLDVLDFEEGEFGAQHAEAGRMLAERWGLPADMALIAGRHHDPCEGMELDLLRIVHLACRLADVLGYDVVKPLVPTSAGEVLAQLPAQARARLNRDPEEFCERIEERIREFGSETAGPPPEETLALLASTAAADGPEPAANVADHQAKPKSSRKPAIVLWAVAAALAAVIAVVFWALR